MSIIKIPEVRLSYNDYLAYLDLEKTDIKLIRSKLEKFKEKVYIVSLTEYTFEVQLKQPILAIDRILIGISINIFKEGKRIYTIVNCYKNSSELFNKTICDSIGQEEFVFRFSMEDEIDILDKYNFKLKMDSYKKNRKDILTEIYFSDFSIEPEIMKFLHCILTNIEKFFSKNRIKVLNEKLAYYGYYKEDYLTKKIILKNNFKSNEERFKAFLNVTFNLIEDENFLDKALSNTDFKRELNEFISEVHGSYISKV